MIILRKNAKKLLTFAIIGDSIYSRFTAEAEKRGFEMYAIITDEGIIGMYDSREDAERVIWECEQADKAHGVFTEGYYDLKEI